MMFVWIGAAVDIPRRVHKYLSTLGPKLYFLRLPKEVHANPEEEYLKQIKGPAFGQKVNAIQIALFNYLKWFELYPFAERDQNSSLLKIIWNPDADDEESIKYVIKLGMLLAHLRGSVPTWDTSHFQGSEYAYSMATIEEPSRAITQLTNLGRNFIAKADISIVIKVVLSTTSIERVAVFDLLLAHGGKLQTSVIKESLNVTSPTALRTMIEFKAIGLVDNKDIGSSHVNEIALKPEFNWFLTAEFQKLRDDYKPEKYAKTETNNTSDEHRETNNANCGTNAGGRQEKNLFTSKTDADINNNCDSDLTLPTPTPVCDIPSGDTATTYFGREIVRCYKGSDWWRCTNYKCKSKSDIYYMRSHRC
jgi:hypothetical protein